MRKIFIMCFLFTLASTTTAFALDKNKSYDELKVSIEENNKTLNEKEEVIEKRLEEIKSENLQTETDLLYLQKKIAFNNRANPNMNQTQFDDLKFFEMLLKSDDFSTFANGINSYQYKYSKINEYKSLDFKKNYLINRYMELNLESESLDKEYKDIELEKIKLEKEKQELEIAMSKKGDIAFNSSNLLEVSNMSVEDAKTVLKGTALEELASIYIEAENTYGVNAFFIMALTAEESAWGTSQRAVNDNNLTGLGVYSDSSTGINSQTKRDNILLTTKLIKNNYLTPNGSYFYGYSIQSVNTKYSTSREWSVNITSIANRLFNKLI